MCQHRSAHLPRQVVALRAAVSRDAFGIKRLHECLTARAPHRNRFGKSHHIFDAREANFVHRAFSSDASALDYATTLLGWVVVPYRTADPEAKQQPVDLMREL